MELLILLIILNYVPCEQGSLETWTTVHGNTSTGHQHLLEHNVKIFLTEIEAYGTLRLQDLTLLLQRLKEQREAATQNGLLLLDSLIAYTLTIVTVNM